MFLVLLNDGTTARRHVDQLSNVQSGNGSPPLKEEDVDLLLEGANTEALEDSSTPLDMENNTCGTIDPDTSPPDTAPLTSTQGNLLPTPTDSVPSSQGSLSPTPVPRYPTRISNPPQ